MKINIELLEQLKSLSLSAPHPKVWIASALVHRNKVISYGLNQMKTHPYQYRYGRNSESIYWHSETSAIYTADKKLNFTKFENSVLYVARMKFDSSEKRNYVSGMAKPCAGCMKCIRHYGIKTIIYTLNEEEICDTNFGVLIL